ncbi:TRAP transporter large permease [Salipaludibacillus agaradhaerens]|uniref:TRAP transporter large permease n=1 Tax=Salipaludibacillus agaradhaerens TaxID=76935 RepID=A0A9Q4B144_SALAG|nr:TRAP transporter large permease [Salipaludibacillus agaradhaerens]MCR6096251.1 TRAP transporter large permease [Salipaludibacillus agaradhaerens]MCR6106845.1 TRAP transporter large permease [Salipaludibacillus agaradhaerens]MCR6114190.1 TRAP transporter large permease [Salipaludibacillus agaradhaerens]MCR6118877.1 TRAP transporter large permease [Salipaludibacillus agaradhaerens]
MIWLLLVILFGLLLIGYPMMVPMIVAPLVVMWVYFPEVDPVVLVQQYYAGLDSFVLLAVPMFIFAADIMSAGKTSQRLLDFIGSFLGHLRGGYAITTAAACTLFGSISGSTQATVAAVGTPMRKKLLESGYKEKQAIPLIINASDLALMIPPSLAMIMYAVVTGTSVGELFIAGILPGIIIFLMFSVYSYLLAKHQNLVGNDHKATWQERLYAFRKALLPLGFPILIIGGIYSGFFSPTEAAAVSVAYAFILEVFVFKTIKIKGIPRIAESSAIVTAAVFILVAAGTSMSWILSYAKLPSGIIASVFGSEPSATYVLIVVAVAFFIGCMFVDPLVVILILTPIFFPVAETAGVDPIALGVIITLQAAIGSATPPFGVDIFTAVAVFNRPYAEIVKGTWPYILILLAASALFIIFPDIITIYQEFMPANPGGD